MGIPPILIAANYQWHACGILDIDLMASSRKQTLALQ